MNNSINSEDYILPPDSVEAYRLAVYFESEWLWKEKNPICRANAARRLSEMTSRLAELEEEEAKRYSEQSVSDEVA